MQAQNPSEPSEEIPRDDAPVAGPRKDPGTEEQPGHGAHGRYGIEEEPIENRAVEQPRIPKDPDEIERNAARDAEVKRTGEDLA